MTPRESSRTQIWFNRASGYAKKSFWETVGMGKLNRTHAIIIASVAAVCVVVGAVTVGSARTGGDGGSPSEERTMGLQDYLDLGNQRLMGLDFEGAVLAFKSAIQIDPNSQDAITGLTTAYYQWAGSEAKGGNYSHALEILTDAQSDLPQDERFPVLYQATALLSDMHGLADSYKDGFSEDYINSVAGKAETSGWGTPLLADDSNEVAFWNAIAETLLSGDDQATSNLIRLCDENGGSYILEDYGIGIYSWDECGGKYSTWTQDKYFREGVEDVTIKGYGVYLGDYKDGKRSDDSALWIVFSVPTATTAEGERYLSTYEHAWCYQVTSVLFSNDVATGAFSTREVSSVHLVDIDFYFDSVSLLSGEILDNYYNGTVTAYSSNNNYQMTLNFDNGTLISGEAVSRSDGSTLPLDQSYGTMHSFDGEGNLLTKTERYGLYGLSWFDHRAPNFGRDGGDIIQILDEVTYSTGEVGDNTINVEAG